VGVTPQTRSRWPYSTTPQGPLLFHITGPAAGSCESQRRGRSPFVGLDEIMRELISASG
jgi:hypothetical protein